MKAAADSPVGCYCRLLALYWLFGVVHEMVHAGLAIVFMTAPTATVSIDWWRVLFDRATPIEWVDEQQDPTVLFSPTEETLVRHAGWAFSLILAILLLAARKGEKSSFSCRDDVIFVACLTALEAITTDLLTDSPTPLSQGPSYTFYCGNFGILLLSDAWFQDSQNRKKALDILELMISTTMVRGAQSGGVVSFDRTTQKATRVRVVNRKRTDLSKKLRKQLESRVPQLPRAYVGHTRFATSSKATLGGTHPHQWSPPRTWRFVDVTGTAFAPHVVENFITHNGDFDFLAGLDGTSKSLSSIRSWLESVTGVATPDPVDSCAVSGVIDVYRTAGSFGLSVRYALAAPRVEKLRDFPSQRRLEEIGKVFEVELLAFSETYSYDQLVKAAGVRMSLVNSLVGKFEDHPAMQNVLPADMEVSAFVADTIRAFFENDLMWATRTFLDRAKGSFGIAATSSIDSQSQLCLAARGQTMSVAFYPSFVLYGSEQAAVKAGLDFDVQDSSGNKEPVLRLDLDDLGGEVLCLDWRGGSQHNADDTEVVYLFNGRLRLSLYQQMEGQNMSFDRRTTRLSGNPLIRRLPPQTDDLVHSDIVDIPRALRAIQSSWNSSVASTSLNRWAAFTLGRALRARLKALEEGHKKENQIDILITGCEVSLWLAEQFAADLQKSLPRLRITAVSSNKLLGLYGQTISLPSIGFPYTPMTYNLENAIVIIVSHSGGTFAPLMCSNLLQSSTNNIFVVTSEWDTQIGRQLRAMDATAASDSVLGSLGSRIFTTEVGVRPAEPCSITVAATHQLLTNLFEHICIMMIEDPVYRRITGAIVTEEDLSVLERCNLDNINAISEIVGLDAFGYPVRKDGKRSRTEQELRDIGHLWGQHVLENARAYILTIIYVFLTVTTGWPVASAIARAGGLEADAWFYVIRIFDAIIYIALPQISVLIIRLFQRRNLRHRMVGRTVVIADIPWVAQCAEAFLSKMFACSYSIAGVNVVSGNPADHFVHRHTHRVVRGSLVLCGRPDGRLSALTTKEAAVCLSVTQASCIQSWGGSCETVTIGHNPSKLPLSRTGIFLDRKRPLFICERILMETDREEDDKLPLSKRSIGHPSGSSKAINGLDQSFASARASARGSFRSSESYASGGSGNFQQRRRNFQQRGRLAGSIVGHYSFFSENSSSTDEIKGSDEDSAKTPNDVSSMIRSISSRRKLSESARNMFLVCDVDKDGFLTEKEFMLAVSNLGTGLSEAQARDIFNSIVPVNEKMDFLDFLEVCDTTSLDNLVKLPPTHRDANGHIQLKASAERYFGKTVRQLNTGKRGNHMDFAVARSQEFAMELYESRIASLQRFVAMTVLFHHMGSIVESFFRRVSFGALGYRTDRTHSILRIATTASPVSGADIKEQMNRLRVIRTLRHAVHVISTAYLKYKSGLVSPTQIEC